MCRANTAIIVDYLLRGVALESVAPTEEVVGLTRVLVRSGVSLAAITRAYILGTQYLIEVWSEGVRRHGPEDGSALEVAQAGTAFLMTWMDVVTAQSADEYRIELERLAREQSLARVEDVRGVLTDDDIDIDAAGQRLSYRIRGRHCALVLRDESARPDGSAVDRTLREMMASLGAGRGLSVRVDIRTTWWWLPASVVEGQELSAPRGSGDRRCRSPRIRNRGLPRESSRCARCAPGSRAGRSRSTLRHALRGRRHRRDVLDRHAPFP